MIAGADYIPSPEQIDDVLAFLPVLEREDFSPSRVEMPQGQFPYHVYSTELAQFHQAVNDGGFVFSFDWPAWQDEAARYVEQPELLRSADLAVLRKLITVHVRKDRFLEGHLPMMVQSGHIASLLRRLKELRDEMAHVRVARADDLSRVNVAYAEFGYTGKAEPEDTVYIAERAGNIIGVVRQTQEHGLTLLRGMYIAPHAQRQGVGSTLLAHFVAGLGNHDCYCVPYTHLTTFYGLGGFEVLPPERAPEFMAKRLEAYRTDGGDVQLMWRPGTP